MGSPHTLKSFKLPSASWYTYQTFSVLRLGTCSEGVFYFLRYIYYIIFFLSCQGKSSIFQRVGEANESRRIFIIHISKEKRPTAFQDNYIIQNYRHSLGWALIYFQVPYLFRYIYYIKEILSSQEESLIPISEEHYLWFPNRLAGFSKSLDIASPELLIILFKFFNELILAEIIINLKTNKNYRVSKPMIENILIAKNFFPLFIIEEFPVIINILAISNLITITRKRILLKTRQSILFSSTNF